MKTSRNEYFKLYREKNREKLIEKGKDYKEKNKEKLIEQGKAYRRKNKEKINERDRNRKKNDPLYKLSCDCRRSINLSLKESGYTKKSHTYDILGCSFEEFKVYLESKFEPWMTWVNKELYNGELNYGWDIDHIMPLSSAKTEEELIKLNHYTNLQPLCSYTNRYIKKDKK